MSSAPAGGRPQPGARIAFPARVPQPAGPAGCPRARLGLRANWRQFTLLVVVNACVGGMVGLERTTTSLAGARVFHLTGYLAVFSFIVAFGVTKAVTNLAAGPLTARHTRKSLFVAGLGLAAIGLIKGLYPLLWGAGQLLTGRLSDVIGRKPLIVAGMIVQAAAFPAALMLPHQPLTAGVISAVLLGAGTAMVYPALIASVADHTHPSWRAQGLAVYRFWRDLRYAAGAVVAGLIAGASGLSTTVLVGGALTLASGLLAARWITGSRHPGAPVGKPAPR